MRPEAERIRHERELRKKLRGIVQEETEALHVAILEGRAPMGEAMLLPAAQQRIARRVEIAMLQHRTAAKDDAMLRDLTKLGVDARTLRASITGRDQARARRAGQKIADEFGHTALSSLSHARTAETGAPLVTNIGVLPSTLVTKTAVTASTEITDAYSEAKYEVGSMLDLALPWRWNALLDRKVCPECAHRDGQEGTLRALGPPPPLHPNCRCFLEVA